MIKLQCAESLFFGKEKINIVRSGRRTLAIEINKNGVLIRAPYGLSDKKIGEFVEKKKKWIEEHLKKREARMDALKNVVPYTMDEMRTLAEKAIRVIPERVRYYAPLIGVNYGKITIRNQRSRWGSCSSAGNLNFNCLLMEFPDEIIDSIVVHELCHRKHMNHSPRFYEEVENVFPRYRECEKWLKENGGAVLSRMML